MILTLIAIGNMHAHGALNPFFRFRTTMETKIHQNRYNLRSLHTSVVKCVSVSVCVGRKTQKEKKPHNKRMEKIELPPNIP